MSQMKLDALKLVVDFAHNYVEQQAGASMTVAQALFLHRLKLAVDCVAQEIVPILERPSLQDALDQCTLWAFGVEEFQPILPERILSHLQEELDELKADPTDAVEMIDCLMLLHHLIVFNKVDAVSELSKKLEINRKRKWQKRQGVEHSKHAESLQD